MGKKTQLTDRLQIYRFILLCAFSCFLLCFLLSFFDSDVMCDVQSKIKMERKHNLKFGSPSEALDCQDLNENKFKTKQNKNIMVMIRRSVEITILDQFCEYKHIYRGGRVAPLNLDQFDCRLKTISAQTKTDCEYLGISDGDEVSFFGVVMHACMKRELNNYDFLLSAKHVNIYCLSLFH